MRKLLLSALPFLFISSITCAQTQEVEGEVFPVEEMSFLKLIELKLKTLMDGGELDALNVRWRQQVANHTNRPKPLDLPRAEELRTYQYRPEIVLESQLQDEKGRVIYPAGTRVNALEKLPNYQPCWLFVNGDDKAQMRWIKRALSSCNAPKMILTGGSIYDAEALLNTVIYFDQAGVITKKLKIKALPARVTRQNNALYIEELHIKENGDVF